MKQPHAYYDLMHEEFLHLESISKLSRNELKNKMRSILSRYIKDRVMLEALVTHDLFLSEYAFLERAQSEPWLQSSVNGLLSIFEAAAKKDKQKFVELLAAFRERVSQAADNCAQIDMLTPPEVPGTTKATVKLAFRDIGDFLEGSFQVFAKFLLSCLYLTTGKDPKKVLELSFGQCVQEILDSKRVDTMYRPSPWEIQLSQWRNISNHNSYRFDLASEIITCEYGTTKKKSFQIAPQELYMLKFNIGKSYNAHKITHAIIFLEYGKEVTALTDNFAVQPETMVHQIKEFTYSHGFAPRQSGPNRALSYMPLKVDDKGSVKYSVVNHGAIADIDERANSLARTISSYMKKSNFQLEVFNNEDTFRSMHHGS